MLVRLLLSTGAMEFEIDDQTRQDLNLFPETRDSISLFGYFDVTITKGGKAALFRLFSNPSNDATLLTNRKDAIRFIGEYNFNFDFHYLDLDFIEHYLSQNIPVLRDNLIDAIVDKASNVIFPSNDFYIIARGISYLKTHIEKLIKFIDSLNKINAPLLIREIITEVEEITNRVEFQPLLNHKSGRFYFINSEDRLIRKRLRDDVLRILERTYLLDAFVSIAKVTVKNNLTFPVYNSAGEPFINIKEMFHPILKDPVSNDIAVGEDGNLCFVSGPNMAGKSTFLKNVGVCVYLAHLGFPVPARQMNTSLFNGIFSSINLSDNISKGYSHYYSEVKRVKEIVLAIKERSRVCIIFDELFKGTNVKDAYDATLMVMTGFAKMKQSIFFASTHIVEVASELDKQNDIIFKYLDSGLDGSTPVYNYKLLDGISSERLGLLIVKQEGVMQIIDEILQKTKLPSPDKK